MSQTLPEPDKHPDEAHTQVTRTRRLPQIDGIELEGEIGRGGMGVVYRGTQAFLQRAVAVKLITSQMIDVMSARFQREARLLSSIAHPNIVGCYQAGVLPSGEGYIVMEFIDGPTLRQKINKGGKLPVAVALRLARDVALALQCAHASGVIHRDVKPENIMLARLKQEDVATGSFAYVPKLVDFGIARIERGTDDITNPGEVIGTCATMAPEQFDSSQAIDHRADIYALGCVLFHALTGRPAFPQKSVAEVIHSKQFGKVPNPRDVVSTLPEPVVRLVQSMLAKNRQDRPASEEVLTGQLLALLAGGTSTVRPQRKMRPMLLAAILVGTGVTAWIVVREISDRNPRNKGADKPNDGGNRVDPRPPALNLPPVVAVAAPALSEAGTKVTFVSTVKDPDSQALTYAWRVVEGFRPDTLDVNQAKLEIALDDAVPETDLAVVLEVSDGANKTTSDLVTVRVQRRSARVGLFPDLNTEPLAGWQASATPMKAFLLDANAVSCDFRRDQGGMSYQLPVGTPSFTGAIQLAEKPLPKTDLEPVAELRLTTVDGVRLTLTHSLGADNNNGLRVAALTRAANPDAAVTELARQPDLPVGKLYVSFRQVEQNLLVVFGAKSQWQSKVVEATLGGAKIEIFGRGGLCRFSDFALPKD